MDKLLLADIGNTHFHIYDGKNVEHLKYHEAIKKYRDVPLKYISVNEDIQKQIGCINGWENISSRLTLSGGYETMGVDRKALCLSHDNGVFVDAGSAITVDIVKNGIYSGGYIFPGIKAMLKAYNEISPALKSELDSKIDLHKLPFTTKEQISYGIIASIKALIDKHSEGKKLYFTGGDGKFLSSFFDDVIYDETLVFRGMLKIIKDKKIC